MDNGYSGFNGHPSHGGLVNSGLENFHQLFGFDGSYVQGQWLGVPSMPSQFVANAPFGIPGMTATTESVGWGGQAIPENNGYRVPWFGRAKGRNSQARGNRGRGRHTNEHQGNQRGKLWNKRRDAQSNSIDDGVTVEDIVRLVRSCPETSALTNEVFRSIRHFDSRTCSVLLKDLSKLGLGNRAVEIFDTIRHSDSQDFQNLCDVYTYTAMISMCIYQQDVDRAFSMVEEMRLRGIERNVHTYTALMNVCIKCGKCQLALESYQTMRDDGIEPNVVTYNTLIDIYGKMGQWEQAVKVLVDMKTEVTPSSIHPPHIYDVTRASMQYSGHTTR